jgi:hypothetical protein
LSTIEEEDEETSESGHLGVLHPSASYRGWLSLTGAGSDGLQIPVVETEEDLTDHFNDIDAFLTRYAEEDLQVEPPDVRIEQLAVSPTYHYTSVGADDTELNCPHDVDEDGNQYVEMLFPDYFAKLILNSPPAAGTCARLRVYVAGNKKAVVERDTDLLTQDEFRRHAPEVAASTLEELNIWVNHQCFQRRPRQGARNILDVRWVAKWKWIK